MKRMLFAPLLAMALGSAGCRADLTGNVQVYTGAVASVQTPASTLAELHSARSVAQSVRRDLSTSVEETHAAVKDLSTRLGGAASALESMRADPEYQAAFKAYQGAWGEYLNAVMNTRAAGAQALFSIADVRKSIDALRAQLSTKLAGKSKRALGAPFYAALAEKAGDTGQALEALERVVCWDGSAPCPDALSPELLAVVEGKEFREAVKRLEERVKTAAAPSKLLLIGHDNIQASLDRLGDVAAGMKAAISAPAVESSWKDADGAMTLAEQALTAAHSATDSGARPEVAQRARDATAVAYARLRSYADALGKIHVDDERVTSDLQILKRFFARPDVAPLVESPPDLERARSGFDAALEVLRRSPGAIRISASLVGKPGFDVTDPNVPRLDEAHWKPEPVDRFEVKASGESDFVIVQEGPTRFTVKQLRFDPKGNAQLAMSVADLGLDIATTVLQQTTGVKVGAPGEGGTSSGASLSGDARSRVASDCRASLRAMSASLNAEIGKISKDAKPADPALVGRIRGMLRGHHALLAACTAALGTTDAAGQATGSK